MQAQRKFIILRMEWLRELPKVRANTVLVSNIPDEWQSDAKVREYFNTLFPDQIKSAYCIKDTSQLLPLIDSLDHANKMLHEAKMRTEQDPGHPPTVRPSFCAAKINAEAYWADQVETLDPQVKEMIKRISTAAKTTGSAGGHCTTGFVTFKERRHAEVAIQLQCIDYDTTLWKVDVPPDPKDIMWVDMTQDPRAEFGREALGYVLAGVLFFLYIPIILAISNLATSLNLGPLQPLWSAFAPTLGLTLMVSFLPTFLKMIFSWCFTLRAEQWSQHKIQVWYFWFQVVFVVLAIAVGTNTVAFFETLVETPVQIFLLLASSMPNTTHFYIFYIQLQWSSFVLCMVRYVPLAKFIGLRKIYEDDQAKKLSEPEDQDYYGQGSRMARFSIALMISIVFGTISPPVWMVSLINNTIIWIAHKYLVIFAETKKPDLGGHFWVTNLRQIFVSLGLYIVLMSGILYLRAGTMYPAIVAALALVYIVWSKHRFETFAWETIPYHDVMNQKPDLDQDESPTPEYTQKELLVAKV